MGAVVPSTLHCASDMLQCIRAGERFLLRAWKREHHQIPWPSSNRHTRSPGPVHTVHIPAAFAASALKLPLSRIIRASDKRLMRALAAMVPTGWPASPRGQAALSVSCVRPRSEPRRAASAGPTVRAYVQPPSAGPGADDSAPGPAAVRRWGAHGTSTVSTDSDRQAQGPTRSAARSPGSRRGLRYRRRWRSGPTIRRRAPGRPTVRHRSGDDSAGSGATGSPGMLRGPGRSYFLTLVLWHWLRHRRGRGG